jgi:hypothetical protein
LTGDGLWLTARHKAAKLPRLRQEKNMFIDYLRQTYFDEVPEPVPQEDEFPTVTRTSLLMAEYEGRTEDLEQELWGWIFKPLSGYQILWHSSKDLTAFLQIDKYIYLFTFAELSSFETGVAEIIAVCRNSNRNLP